MNDGNVIGDNIGQVDGIVPDWPPWWRILITATAYFGLAQAGLWLASPPIFAAPIWPAAGIALVAVLKVGRCAWAGVWLGAFAAEFSHWSALPVYTGLVLAGAMATGATIQALAGARLLRPVLRAYTTGVALPALMARILFGIPVVATLSASMGSMAAHLLQGVPLEAFWTGWIVWWAGDCIGILLMLPLLVALDRYYRKMAEGAWPILALPLLTALLATAGYYWLAGAERVAEARALSADGEHIRDDFVELLAQQDQSVAAIADLFAAREDLQGVTEAEFVRFTRRAVGVDGIEWLGWAQPPPTEWNLDPAQWPGETRLADTGLLLRHLNSRSDQPPAIESSLHARENLRLIVRQAIDSGHPAQVLTCLQQEGTTDCRLLLIPVYDSGIDPVTAMPAARRAALKGVALGCFSIRALRSKLQDYEGMHHYAVSLRVQGEAPAASPPGHGGGGSGSAVPSWQGRLGGIGGAALELTLRARDPWQPGQSPAMRLYLLGSVVVLVFSNLLVLIAAGQNVRIGLRVRQRTDDLRESEKRLQEINASLEQHVAERTSRLQDSERFMRTLLDALSAQIVVLDDSGVIVATNRAWREFSQQLQGRSRRAGQGENYLDACMSAGAEKADEARLIGEVIQGTRSAIDFEYVQDVARDKCWFMCRVTRFEGSGQVHVVLAHQDITARKWAEQKTQALADELQATLQTIPDLLFDFDENGRYHQIWSSDGALLMGSREVLLGRLVTEILPPEAAQTVCIAIQEALRTQRSSGYQICLRKHAEERWYELSVAAKQRREAGPGRVILLARDVSRHKQIEKELQQLNDELEDRIRIRTEQLTQARQDAEQASKAKSAFLATMSHEIRTPLNGVIGMIDVLEQTPLEPQQLEMVELIGVSASSLLDIIDDILDLSKIEAGGLTLERSIFSVEGLVEQSCAMVNSQALKHGVELTLFVAPEIPAVLGDEVRVRQILLNLLSNAIKFTSGRPEARVAVRATLVERGADGVQLEFRIEDNGIGMEEQTQAALFTAFRQADASTTRRFGGTGLGLAITHRLVSMMDGSIDVASAADQGSVFTVRITFTPAATESENDTGTSRVAGLACILIGPEGSPVDDFGLYLEYAGAQVVRQADDGAAREWMQQQPHGRFVWIIDISGNAAADGDAGPASHDPRYQVCYLLLDRGRRRRARRIDDRRVTIDANLLTRRELLDAVAAAAGRLQMPDDRQVRVRPSMDLHAIDRDEARDRGRLILVAEDNVANQKVLLHQLALLGYAADIAQDGLQALDLWCHGTYALLLTDLHMPNMDGYQLTEAIRSQETAAERFPIIALTANALKGEAKRCIDVGMDEYLSKPVRLESLRRVLTNWIPGEAAPACPEPRASDLPPAVAAAGTINEREQQAVDLSVLKELVGNDPAVVQEFLGDFHRYGGPIADELLHAYYEGNLAEVGALAHKLKSSSRSIGAVRLSDCCIELEQAVGRRDRELLAQLTSRFSVELAAVMAYIGEK